MNFTNTVMSKEALFYLLTIRGVVRVTINGVTGVLTSVERESGNGRTFNVTLDVGHCRETVFVKCH